MKITFQIYPLKNEPKQTKFMTRIDANRRESTQKEASNPSFGLWTVDRRLWTASQSDPVQLGPI
jgi:hypothetical protein